MIITLNYLISKRFKLKDEYVVWKEFIFYPMHVSILIKIMGTILIINP